MSYDAWKTREYDDPYEGSMPVCEHYQRGVNLCVRDGTLLCSDCAHEYDRAEREDWLANQPFPYRLRHRWIEFRWWLRWTALRWVWHRPINAVRSWWRGWRPAPWRPDDEIPF